MASSFIRITFAALSIFILCFGTAQAQVNWWRMDDNAAFTLEWSKANFADGYDEDLGFLNTVAFIGAQVRVSPSLSIIGELPIATWDVKDPYTIDVYGYTYKWDDEIMIGNPFLGIEYSAPGSANLIRFGVRPPVASDDKSFAPIVGIYGATDRLEAFIPDLWTVSASGGFRSTTETGAIYRFLIGPTFLVPDQGDAEMLADYSGFIGYQGMAAHFGVSLSGRMILTEDTDEFSDRFDHFLGVVAGLRAGTVEPGVQFHYSLDEEYRELVDFTFGINLKVNLGSEEY